jgi:iron complex transport system substrate-binding protein
MTRWLKGAGGGGVLAILLVGAVQADPITITDLAGRTLKLDRPAERIVTFPVPMAATVIALDQSPDRLVGIHPESEIAIDNDILGEFFPKARDIESGILARGTTGRLDFQPNVEVVKALQPDLVIEWGFADEENTSRLEKAGLNVATSRLEKAGLNVALIVRGPNDEFMREALGMIGTAIGRSDRARMLIDWRDAVSAEISAGIRTVPDSIRPKAAYFLYSTDELWTEGGGTHGDWQLSHVGARNAAAEIQSWQKKVSHEQVAAWNPEVIFISTFKPDTHVNDIYNHPILSDTIAAKTKRVYQIPLGGYRWDPASPESPLAWMWYTEILHPDVFNFDIRAEIKEWYPKLYGHTPSEEQIDKILRMDMNSGSAGYERFAAK